ncbi:S-layer homology domain-containing protein [Lysinibacillus sp. NPDC097287]|uniref:S-layer homology domain-containing protein n=1 Tax=Lysinibacillus sp. NPDC097287 TaxID=3364144 RepID=UPI00380C76D9
MKKTILAGALTITCLTGGFGLQVQAQGNLDVPSLPYEKPLVASTNVSQVQALSYQDIYKMLVLSKLTFEDGQMTVVTDKNSITMEVSLEMIKQSYEDGTNLYPEGKAAFIASYAEFKKVFGDTIKLRFSQAGKSVKAEIYAEGKWQAGSAQELSDLLMVFNRADIDLKTGGYFTDVIGHWAEGYIQFLYQVGIINGTSDTTFNPTGQVTRGQLAAMIFNASGLDVNEDYEGPATYNDMQGFWGAKEVAILQEYGLIDIFDGDNFEPNKPVTREEMAYVTARYLEAMEFDVQTANKNNTFADKGQMREEAIESIGLLQQLKILDSSSGKFNPKGNLTRAQFSKILTLSVMMLAEEE